MQRCGGSGGRLRREGAPSHAVLPLYGRAPRWTQVVVIQGNMQSRVPDLLRAEYNIGSKFVSVEAKRKAPVKKGKGKGGRGRGGKR